MDGVLIYMTDSEMFMFVKSLSSKVRTQRVSKKEVQNFIPTEEARDDIIHHS